MRSPSLILTFLASLMLMPFSISYASSDIEEHFEQRLHNISAEILGGAPLYKDDLIAFYEARHFKPVWLNEDNRELEDIQELKGLIYDQAILNGLEPDDYEFEEALNLTPSELNNNFLDREWRLTNTVMHYINDIRTGRIKPHKYDSMIFTLPQHRALDKRMAKLIKTSKPEKYLESLPPQQPEYKKLRSKLSAFREIAEQGGWQKINAPHGTVLYPGEAHNVILKVRMRLENAYKAYDGQLPEDIWLDDSRLPTEALADRIEHQDLESDQKDEAQAERNPALLYDGKLAKRIAEFQYFHGKKADGVIGPETLAALDTPVEERINQIKLSMERWRWLPDNLGRKHVRVNIAAFYARAVENGQDQFVMPIIVGKVAHQTPVFSSVIKNVKIHPDWTSPDSIAGRYVIPKIQNNPGIVHHLGYQAISKQNGQVVPWTSITPASLNTRDYIFRQKPGRKNALGLARFSIENDYAIFMHGTPSQSLFNEDNRNFSSGCVRLENPLVMAHFLLNDQGISKRELEDLYYLDDGEFPDTTYVDLKEDVPVHLMYMTAWVDQKGHVHFADDAYGRDKKLKQALARLN